MIHRVTFWQRAPSMHWAALLRELAGDPRFSVTLATSEDIGTARRGLGWSDSDFGAVNMLEIPRDSRVSRLFGVDPNSESHVFSGFRAYPAVHKSLEAAIAAKARIGVFAENVDGRGVAGLARRVSYSVQAAMYRGQIEFLLATGKDAVQFYRRAGFPSSQVFEFGYFVDRPTSELYVENEAVFRIVFVGQLINRKGVDLLLKALTGLPRAQWSLDVIGSGPAQGELEVLRHRLGLDRRVSFCGILPNTDVVNRIGGADLLVLPSRFDGWGAVVNEALVVGTPVVASSNCGSSSLILGPLQGTVFPSGDIHALTNALNIQLASGIVSRTRRTALRQWATRIQGAAAARYLAEILLYDAGSQPRPAPPWHEAKRP